MKNLIDYRIDEKVFHKFKRLVELFDGKKILITFQNYKPDNITHDQHIVGVCENGRIVSERNGKGQIIFSWEEWQLLNETCVFEINEYNLSKCWN
ncbi:MAG: hypothetical protein M0Q38_00920 [Bacteroidales bacterium]|jgi:hypothetical protein|nr:hypothetical protein [Bacteroidales bacterium]